MRLAALAPMMTALALPGRAAESMLVRDGAAESRNPAQPRCLGEAADGRSMSATEPGRAPAQPAAAGPSLRLPPQRARVAWLELLRIVSLLVLGNPTEASIDPARGQVVDATLTVP